MKTPIDKLRDMVAFFDARDEHFNQRVRSVTDFEKVYDSEMKVNRSDLDMKEQQALNKKLNSELGYELYK